MLKLIKNEYFLEFRTIFCYNTTTIVERGCARMQTFGEQLRAVRKAREMTQDQLALMVNVSRPTISHWEMGRVTPDIDTIKLLSQVLEHNFFAMESVEEAAQPAQNEAPAPLAEMPEVQQPPVQGVQPGKRSSVAASAIAAVITAVLCMTCFWLLPRINKGEISLKAIQSAVMIDDYEDLAGGRGWYFQFEVSNEGRVPFTPDRAIVIFYAGETSTDKLVLSYDELLVYMESEKFYPGDEPVTITIGSNYLYNSRAECILQGTDDNGNKLESRASVDLLQP